MTEREKLAKQYCDKFPGAPQIEIARNLFEDHPTKFKSIDSVKFYIRGQYKKETAPDKLSDILSPEEVSLIESYRSRKSLLEKECKEAGIDISSVKHYWYKSEMFSVFAKPNQRTLDQLKKEMMEGMKEYSPSFKKIVRPKIKDGHCLVVDPADIHIGKLASAYESGDTYNVKIAVKRVLDGVDGILSKVSNYPIDQIVLIIGNDILHTDNARRTTTSGTPQDTDGQWYDNFLIAQDLYVQVITKLMNVAKVHVVHNVSNHDYMTGWFLAQVIQTWFRKCNDITFDCDMKHRKAYRYHDNLIATTHGDGAKEKDLNALLAHEYPKMWAQTKHRYIYTHHIHHKTAKDMIGVTVESSRSASGTDSWHSRNGYVGGVKAIEGYIHHKTQGQIARITHIFN